MLSIFTSKFAVHSGAPHLPPISNSACMFSTSCRGIPTDIHPATGKSALETVLTVLHAGGKFGGDSSNGNGSDGSGYRVSGGLHGVGISVVNALSAELHVEVLRNALLYKQSFSRGNPVTDLLQEPAPAEAYASGTKVSRAIIATSCLGMHQRSTCLVWCVGCASLLAWVCDWLP